MSSSILTLIQDEFIYKSSVENTHRKYNHVNKHMTFSACDIIKKKLSHKGDIIIYIEKLSKKNGDGKSSEKMYIKNIEISNNNKLAYLKLNRNVVLDEILKNFSLDYLKAPFITVDTKIFCYYDNDILGKLRISLHCYLLKKLHQLFKRTAHTTILSTSKQTDEPLLLEAFPTHNEQNNIVNKCIELDDNSVNKLYVTLKENDRIRQENNICWVDDKYKVWTDEQKKIPSKTFKVAALLNFGETLADCHCIYLMGTRYEQMFYDAQSILTSSTSNGSIQSFCPMETKNDMKENIFQERKDELRRSYEERYGNKVAGEAWDEKINEDALSALKLDFLFFPPNKKVNMSREVTRNSVFILYNYARLVKINEHFTQKVEQGVYPPLCDRNDADFSLLIEQNEWNLVVRYVIAFPMLLQEVFMASIQQGRVKLNTNQIYQFLLSMSRDTSAYYHHSKILLEARPHLFPLIHARLHLLNTVKKIMEECFSLLAINPPTQM